MGELHSFNCKACGYSAEVSGGKDRGFVAFTQTKVCQDCRQVVDVLIGKISELSGGQAAAIPRAKQRCPECGGQDLKVWKPRVCPKCGEKMEKGFGAVCMWD